jgi:Tfp pilus assembly protein PilX
MRPAATLRDSERGSALLLALLCVVLLTLIGIALAVITSGELGIASNESDVNRAFYGAESGLDTGAAWARLNLPGFEAMTKAGTPDPTSPFTTGTGKTLVRTTVGNMASTTPTINVVMPVPGVLAVVHSPDAGLGSNLFTFIYRVQSTATDTTKNASHAITENLQIDNVKEHI